MLPGQLRELDEELLASVCTERWPESQTLDFKRVLPGTDDKSRQEFLKDVARRASQAPKLQREWSADTLLKALNRLHEDFYPKPRAVTFADGEVQLKEIDAHT